MPKKVIDFELGIKILQGDEPKYISLLNQFVDKTPTYINDLSTAFRTRDWEKLRAVSHAIKCATGYMGASILWDRALKLKILAEEKMKKGFSTSIYDCQDFAWKTKYYSEKTEISDQDIEEHFMFLLIAYRPVLLEVGKHLSIQVSTSPIEDALEQFDSKQVKIAFEAFEKKSDYQCYCTIF